MKRFIISVVKTCFLSAFSDVLSSTVHLIRVGIEYIIKVMKFEEEIT